MRMQEKILEHFAERFHRMEMAPVCSLQMRMAEEMSIGWRPTLEQEHTRLVMM